MSNMVTIAISAKSATKALATIFSSISLVNFFFLALNMAINSQRPPSSAGIGNTFIQAKETESNAAKNAKLAGPAEVNAGNSTPIIPTGPDTESPTEEIASCPFCRTYESGLNCEPTPDIKFQTITPRPLKVSPVSCAVKPTPTIGADQVE